MIINAKSSSMPHLGPIILNQFPGATNKKAAMKCRGFLINIKGKVLGFHHHSDFLHSIFFQLADALCRNTVLGG